MNQYVTRQHSDTELTEIIGKNCIEILGVAAQEENAVFIFYLKVDNFWLRMFIDERVLFVDTCESPDRENDLEQGEDYINIRKVFNVQGNNIVQAKMANGTFVLQFSDGEELIFIYDEDGSSRLIKKR